MYKSIIRPILFRFDPEKIHHFTFGSIRFLHKIPGVPALLNAIYEVNDPRLEREVFGLRFKNPVGLAAGLDKDAKLYKELSNLGFGFIEIGTLTPKGQEGNPKKRLFRLKFVVMILKPVAVTGTFLSPSKIIKNWLKTL
jgi:dihydroorotate dehydrogenase